MSSSKHLKPNTFFDINKFPPEEGLLVFGISMNQIGNKQSAEKCFEYLRHFDSRIEKTEGIGLLMLYSDYLYLHSESPAHILRERYKNLMFQHKHAFLNILSKNPNLIKKAFSFYTFGQMMLDNSEDILQIHTQILNLYESDSIFHECVAYDIQRSNRDSNEHNAAFILEELALFYMIKKESFTHNNSFVLKNNMWTLMCYPGKPLKSEVYLFQKNPLNLSNPKNKYENSCYDLESQTLYDYTRIDIEAFDFS